MIVYYWYILLYYNVIIGIIRLFGVLHLWKRGGRNMKYGWNALKCRPSDEHEWIQKKLKRRYFPSAWKCGPLNIKKISSIEALIMLSINPEPGLCDWIRNVIW